MTSVKVPPTSTPILALLFSSPTRCTVSRYEISNREAGRTITLVSEALKGLEPLARESVEDKVADALRDLIVSGQLPEGTPLVQRELAKRLGVSQTPVRVGLTELQRGGLVEVAETGRAFVSRLTREDLEELYAARRGLEGLAARLGAAAVGPAQLERMRTLLAELERQAKGRDVDGYLRTRWAFHAACYEAAGRSRLLAEVARLYWRGERYNRLVLSNRERFRRSVAYYRRFFEACRARDARAAERVIQESTQWAVDLLWDSLPSERDT
jgi:DNA-binding GntR family transcriptional regulator